MHIYKKSLFVRVSIAVPSLLLIGTALAAAPELDVSSEIVGPIIDNRGLQLFEPSIPPENPITEEKRVLGKMLFWDEQLSSDNTMSCGTCHIPNAGGGDPRHAKHPGFDNLFDTPDDVSGSPGMIAMDSNEEYFESVLFKLLPQSGNRVSPSNLMAPYGFNLFWDGRAENEFLDPLTGEVAIPAAGMLEEQSLGPILNPLELAHSGRTWEEVTTKLDRSRPMALATDLPPDVAAVLDDQTSYNDLFASAFGDSEITPVRIAMAIATYERTTLPNQTPWDEFMAGDEDALTPRQIQGFTAFSSSRCFFCHVSPVFTNNRFHADGVRAPHEDPGRSGVSGNESDRGLFRSPSLRNVGLRDRFMHTGTLESLDDVFDFYAHRNGFQPALDNLDPRIVIPIVFAPQAETAVKDFLLNGLTDPRVAAETFPFDRPQLYSEQLTPNPELIPETGRAGSGGLVPEPIAVTPPLIGSEEFKIGIKNAIGGANAWMSYSWTGEVVDGELVDGKLIGPIPLIGSGVGNGYATFKFPIENDPRYENAQRYFQWRVEDPGAKDGIALSPIVSASMFCSMSGACPDYCIADYTNDDQLDIFDVLGFVELFNEDDGRVDLDQDGALNIFDVIEFIEAFNAGCEG